MAGETNITIVGNLTADPELRYTPGGKGVCKFTVASTDRRFDKASGKFEDGDTLFMYVSAWQHLGEHAAESLAKGTRVVVTGPLRQRSYEDKEGVKRTVYEVTAEEIGVSLKFATAKPVKATSSGGGGNVPPADDPWASGTGSSGAFEDEPPF